MAILETRLNSTTQAFSANKAAMSELVSTFKNRLSVAAQGGGAESIDRHKSRGKLLARERIQAVIDPGTEFLEFSALTTYEMYDNNAPNTKIITKLNIIQNHK